MLDLCAIRKIQTAIRRFEETLRSETGLSLNDAMCLCGVRRGVTEPGQLARELELSPSRLTRILDDLERRELVRRTLSDEDRRSLTVSLTEGGLKLIERYSCTDIEIPRDLAFTQGGGR